MTLILLVFLGGALTQLSLARTERVEQALVSRTNRQPMATGASAAPEFAFETDPANVQRATAGLGVSYPVALDADEQGYGRVDSQRLYQLIRQSNAVREHDFSIQFQDDGLTVYAFTFG